MKTLSIFDPEISLHCDFFSVSRLPTKIYSNVCSIFCLQREILLCR